MRAHRFLAIIFGLAGALQVSEAEVLETVAEVRSLSLEEAEKGLPVELAGTVTYVDEIDGHAFLSDRTGGIFFRGGKWTDPRRAELEAGDRVRIRGVTVRGGFSPSVAGGGSPGRLGGDADGVPVEVEKLGEGSLPEPPEIDPGQLATGLHHDQLVRVRGTIRAVRGHDFDGRQRVTLEISSPRIEGTFRAFLPAMERLPEEWENLPAEISGVVAGGGDERSELQNVRLLVPSADQVKVGREAIEDAFARDPLPFDGLFRYDPRRGDVRRARVRGVVTHVRPGEGFYLGSERGGLWVETVQGGGLRPGTVLDVVGQPARDDRGSHLQDAIYRVAGVDPPPMPREVRPGEAASGRLGPALVKVEGELVETLEQPGAEVLFLQNAGRSFRAEVVKGRDANGPPPLGSWLAVTGILEQPDQEAAGIGPAFHLLARGPGDVEILRRPPWLTPARLRALWFGLLTMVVLAALWAVALRRQVAKQARVIREQTAERTLTEERQRIARELHDTLEQQLAGVQLHLNALGDWSTEAPPTVRRTLAAARGMLDHSRSEARRSVFELRSPVLEQAGLVEAVRQMSAAMEGPPSVGVEVRGDPRRLPRATEFHLLRIVQEAMANAVKHSEARQVRVAFDFSPEVLRVEVSDDGRGFTTGAAQGGEPRFGLIGIRERVAKIGGRLELDPGPGRGTRLSVEVPQVTNP